MLGEVVAAGRSWAPFVALQRATAADFDAMDADGQGAVVLSEFCGWVVGAEKASGTAWGKQLSIGDHRGGGGGGGGGGDEDHDDDHDDDGNDDDGDAEPGGRPTASSSATSSAETEPAMALSPGQDSVESRSR